MTRNIISLLDELRSIAQLGLNYTEDEYDKERYERLLDLASQNYETLCALPTEEVKSRFQKELGYITPKVGVSASIFNENGQQLLVKRTDDYTYCLPCGWAEVGETPQDSLKREVEEETGLIVDVHELIYLGSRMPGDFDLPHTSYHLQFYCVVKGGQIRESHETTDIDFYNIDEIDNWHRDHQIEANIGQEYWKKSVVKL